MQPHKMLALVLRRGRTESSLKPPQSTSWEKISLWKMTPSFTFSYESIIGLFILVSQLYYHINHECII